MTSRKRSSSETEETQTKKSRVSYKGTPSKTDSNGDPYWEVSKMRRVTISKFRGKTLVNLREYYEKDGQELPGKKGISMPMDQFAAFVKILPDIEKCLEDQGESLPRPEYFVKSGDEAKDEGSDEDMKGDGEASPSKQNIEATSDEESE